MRRAPRVCLLGLVAVALLVSQPYLRAPATTTGGITSSEVAAPENTGLSVDAARDAFARLPLSFEPNRGQAAPDVRFVARGSRFAVALTATEAAIGVAPSPTSTTGSVLRVRMVGADASAAVVGLGPLEGRVHYLGGDDPSRRAVDVPLFDGVRVVEAYPGVDIRWYGDQRRIEYDFEVSAGADPSAITLEFAGAEALLDSDGNIAFETPAGTVVQAVPGVYQDIGGQRRAVPARYVPKGRNQVGIALAGYETGNPLVIDPAITYSTYLGSDNDPDQGLAIAVDAPGNAYITGFTFGGFPVVTGAFDGTYNPVVSGFVAKLKPDGAGLVYSTYLGGASTAGQAIAVDSSGSAYVTGSTRRTTFTGLNFFPTTAGAFDTTFNGSSTSTTPDAFVTKLTPNGGGLAYSTLLGGPGADEGRGIAVDTGGNAYVTGTAAAGLPPSFGPFNGGASDAFVAKLNPSGASLLYSRYLGGSADDQGAAITLNGSTAMVTGGTASSNFPVVSAWDPTLNGGSDAFVTVLGPNGAITSSTFLGGSGTDAGRGIAFRAVTYVTGSTGSPNFPTAVAYDPTYNGGASDAFVSVFAGATLIRSTFLGGVGDDAGTGIAVSLALTPYVSGSTASVNFPRTFGPTLRGAQDGFVTKLTTLVNHVLFSTYLGGDGDFDVANAIAVRGPLEAFVTGQSSSANFPTTPGAMDVTGGGPDGFVTRLLTDLPRS